MGRGVNERYLKCIGIGTIQLIESYKVAAHTIIMLRFYDGDKNVCVTHNGGHDHGEVSPDVAAELGGGRVYQFVDVVLGVSKRGLILGEHTRVDVHNHDLVLTQQFLERRQSSLVLRNAIEEVEMGGMRP